MKVKGQMDKVEKPRLAHVARCPVIQEEWSVIQKLRAQGKNNLSEIM